MTSPNSDNEPTERIIELRLPSRLGYEKVAMDTASSLARRMGFGGDRVEALRTAIAEAVTNAIEHGNEHDSDMRVIADPATSTVADEESPPAVEPEQETAPELETATEPEPEIELEPEQETAPELDTATEPEPEPEAEIEPEPEADVLPWQPRFDQNDDLSGLLKARGRLLSRAFRGVTADGA